MAGSLYTMNGADWSKRYPLIVRDAARIDGSAIIDAEVVSLNSEGMAVFDARIVARMMPRAPLGD